MRERGETEQRIRMRLYDIMAFLSSSLCTEDLARALLDDLDRIAGDRLGKPAAEPAEERIL